MLGRRCTVAMIDVALRGRGRPPGTVKARRARATRKGTGAMRCPRKRLFMTRLYPATLRVPKCMPVRKFGEMTKHEDQAHPRHNRVRQCCGGAFAPHALPTRRMVHAARVLPPPVPHKSATAYLPERNARGPATPLCMRPDSFSRCPTRAGRRPVALDLDREPVAAGVRHEGLARQRRPDLTTGGAGQAAHTAAADSTRSAAPVPVRLKQPGCPERRGGRVEGGREKHELREGQGSAWKNEGGA